MELRVCPDCQKAFYSSPEGESVLCPHCGFVLLEKRLHKRTRKVLDFFFSYHGKKHGARLEDYSDSGVRAVYTGPGVDPDTVLEFDIDELDIHGKVRAVWTRELGKSRAESGFMLI